jgi:hypothetical protein
MPGTSSTLDHEWSLLTSACSQHSDKEELRQAFSRSPVRWSELFDLADHHGVHPLLYQALSTFAEDLPSEEMRSLKQGYQQNLHKALLLSRELIRIVDCLHSRNIRVLPYKGLALAQLVYGDIALRQSGDIDLLIRSQDLAAICEAVAELGYSPHKVFSKGEEEHYLESGYECAFDAAAGRNLLEVQWALQPRFYAVDLNLDGVFQRAQTARVAGYPIVTPSLEDLFVVLSLHAAKHVWSRLIWLCDLARIGVLPDLNWKQIGAQAVELGIVRILRVTLILSNLLLKTSIPAEAENALPPDRGAAVMAQEVLLRMKSDSAFDVESLAYFRLMLQLRERRADQMRFLRRLAFTPGPGEWDAVRLPRPLFPLYRVVRLSRLASRLVRS